MDNSSLALPCSIIRGGSSKGVFFLNTVLPPAGQERDQLILAALGSPDPHQIDGLGGATTTTSKVCIIAPSSHPDADIDYTFGQVIVDKPMIDWRGYCGNLVSGVGLFAIDHQLLIPQEPETVVRIHNTNTGAIIHVSYPVHNGQLISDGTYQIPGVPGGGAKLKVSFLNPGGSVCGKLLPTGHTVDVINCGTKGCFKVSIIDATTPLVLMDGRELGLTGKESSIQIASRPALLELIDEVRCICAELLGFVEDSNQAPTKSPAYPKIGYILPACDYVASDGKTVAQEDIDFIARVISGKKPHPTYMVTGAIATGAAACIPGTILHSLLPSERRDSTLLRIGQPYGVMEVLTEMSGDSIISGSVYRTARKIMDGTVFVSRSKINVI